MDTTEQYIKMCDEAKLPWEPKEGDWYSYSIEPCSLDDPCHGFYTESRIGIYTLEHPIPENAVPLWRQDQLQEIAHVCECSDPVCLLIDFHKFVDRESNPDIEHSWEQLWLAFTMHELHNKKWAGEKWEIVKE